MRPLKKILESVVPLIETSADQHEKLANEFGAKEDYLHAKIYLNGKDPVPGWELVDYDPGVYRTPWGDRGPLIGTHEKGYALKTGQWEYAVEKVWRESIVELCGVPFRVTKHHL